MPAAPVFGTPASTRDAEMIAASYATFLVFGMAIYKFLSDGLSSLLTLSAGLQALGFVLLVLKSHGQSRMSGISARMLLMYVLTLIVRLSSTLTMHGYLPADATGDGPYQVAELLSLGLAVWLLQRVLHARRVNYGGDAQDDQDSMPGLPLICVFCIALASVFHGDLNHDKLFDGIWACACYMETAAMLPQLWMMSNAGGEVEALTSHFIALTTLSRFFSLSFWYLAFADGIGFNGNVSEMAIIGAHIVQLVLSLDFLVLYIKSFGQRVTLGSMNAQWI